MRNVSLVQVVHEGVTCLESRAEGLLDVKRLPFAIGSRVPIFGGRLALGMRSRVLRFDDTESHAE